MSLLERKSRRTAVNYKGLQLSILGAVLAIPSVAAIMVLSLTPAAASLVVGSLMVWAGLAWTLSGPEQQPPAAPTG
jgi:hypothetical protein